AQFVDFSKNGQLGVYCRNESGEMVGGLIADRKGPWLCIDYLWKGPFVRYELTPENAGQLETFIDQAQGGTLVLSHPEYLTREQQ
ncbi:hypothetical protein MJL30_39370, partial [Salmonella enterica subsp. enterica serovar Anatum]|nr:hypothetical protein [Salmonella enterica subsp. enterica serovar Anatum]